MLKRIVLLSLVALGAFASSLHAQNFQISGGHAYSAVLCSNGSIFTWGDNQGKQLGRDTMLAYDETPTMISADLPPMKSVDAGSGGTAIALACDGTVWTWGEGAKGQLGHGLLTALDGSPCNEMSGNCNAGIPVQVVGGETGDKYLQNITYVTSSTMGSYVITEDGELYGWGNNSVGAIGLGATTPAVVPAPVKIDIPGGGKVSVVDATDYGAYILVDDNGDGVGAVYGLGKNDNQSITPGGGELALKPTPILKEDGTPLDNVVMITAGDTHGLFLDADGYLWAIGGDWGEGQLGISEKPFVGYQKGYAYKVLAGAQQTIPGYEDEPYLANVQALSAGNAHSMAIVEYYGVRYMMVWGANSYGQGGQGSVVKSLIKPHFVMLNANDTLKNVQSISDGDFTSYATTYDPDTKEKQTYVWGGSEYGQVGGVVKEAVTYPKEFIEPECKPADPCPTADLGPDTLKVCPSEMDPKKRLGIALNAGDLGSENFTYEWEIHMDNGMVLNDPAMIARFLVPNTNGQSLYAYFEGKYIVNVIDNTPATERLCDPCEPAVDSVVILYKTPTFDSDTADFCGTDLKVDIFNAKGKKYALFAEEEGGDALDVGVPTGGELTLNGGDLSLFEQILIDPITDKPYHKDSIYYRAWIEDSTINTGTLLKGVSSCAESSVKQAVNLFQQITVYTPKVVLNSLTLDVDDTYGSNAIDVTVTVYGQHYDNNTLQANRKDIISQSKLTTTITSKGEVTIPADIELAGSAGRGKSYWIGLEYSSNFNISVKKNCGKNNEADDYSGGVIYTGLTTQPNAFYDPGRDAGFYDMEFGLGADYTCGRVPVTVQLLCPPCSPAQPEMTAEKDAICSHETTTISTVLEYEKTDTDQLHNVYWFKGELTLEEAAASIGSALQKVEKVAYGDDLPDLSVTYDKAGYYTVFVMDAVKNVEDCYKISYVYVDSLKSPKFTLSGGANYCSDVTDITPLVVKMEEGAGPYTVSYTINTVAQTDAVTADGVDTVDLELPSTITPGMTYQYLVTDVIDDNGCMAEIEDGADPEEIGIYENPEVVFTEPSETFCIGRDAVDLSDHVGPLEEDEDGFEEFYFDTDGGVLTSSALEADDLSSGANAFKYKYVDSHGCADSVDFEITVNVAPTVDLTASFDGELLELDADSAYHVCLTNELDLDGGAESADGAAMESHKWSISGSGSPLDETTVENPTFVVSDETNAGLYELVYLVEDENTCTAQGKMKIEVHAPDEVTMHDTTVCADEDAFDVIVLLDKDLSANSNTDFSEGADITTGTFDPESVTVTASEDFVGTLKVTTEYGCESESDFTVTVNPIPTVTLSADEDVCIYVESIPVSVSPAGGDFGTSAGINTTDNVFVPADAAIGENEITYTVKVDGCENSKTITITVNDTTALEIDDIADICVTEKTIDVSSALTPALSTGETGTLLSSSVASVTGTDVDITVAGTNINFPIDLKYDYVNEHGCESTTSSEFSVHYTPAVAATSAIGVNVGDETEIVSPDYVNAIEVDGEDDATFIWTDFEGTELTSVTGPSLDVKTLDDPKYIAPGTYEYTVVQVLNDCPSEPTTQTLTISKCEAPAAVKNDQLEYCAGETVPAIVAESTDSDFTVVGVFTAVADIEGADPATAVASFTPNDADLIADQENLFYTAVYDETNKCWGAPTTQSIYKHSLPELEITGVNDDYCSYSSASPVFNAGGKVIASEEVKINGTLASKNFNPESYTSRTTPIEIEWSVITDAGCKDTVKVSTNVHHISAPEVADAIWQIKEDADPDSKMIITTDETTDYVVDVFDKSGATTPIETDVDLEFVPAGTYFTKDAKDLYEEQDVTFFFNQTVTISSALSCVSEKSSAVYKLSKCNLGAPVVAASKVEQCANVNGLPEISADYGNVYDESQTDLVWMYNGAEVARGASIDWNDLQDAVGDIVPSADPYVFSVHHFGPSIDAPHENCQSADATVTFEYNYAPIPQFDLPAQICFGDEIEIEYSLLNAAGEVTKKEVEITGEGVSNPSTGVPSLATAGLDEETKEYTISGTFITTKDCSTDFTGKIEVVFVPAPVIDPMPLYTLESILPKEITVADHDALSGDTYRWYTKESTPDNSEVTTSRFTAAKDVFEIRKDDYELTPENQPHKFFVRRNIEIATNEVCESEASPSELFIFDCPASAPTIPDSKGNCSLIQDKWEEIEITLNDYKVPGFDRDEYKINFYQVGATTPFSSVLNGTTISVQQLYDDLNGIADNAPVTIIAKEESITWGCESDQSEFVVKINKPSAPVLTTQDDEVCQEDGTTLEASGISTGNDVEWITPDDKVNDINQYIDFTIEDYPASENPYVFNAIQRDVNGCPSEESTVEVTVNYVPAMPQVIDPPVSTNPIDTYVACDNNTHYLEAVHDKTILGEVKWSKSKNFDVAQMYMGSGNDFDPSRLSVTNGENLHTIYVRKENGACVSENYSFTVDLISRPAKPLLQSSNGTKINTPVTALTKYCNVDVFGVEGMEGEPVLLRLYDDALIEEIAFNDNYDVLWYMGHPIDMNPTQLSSDPGFKFQTQAAVNEEIREYTYHAYIQYYDAAADVECLSDPGIGEFIIEKAPRVEIAGDSLLCNAMDPYTEKVNPEYSDVLFNIKVFTDIDDTLSIEQKGFDYDISHLDSLKDVNSLRKWASTTSDEVGLLFSPKGVSIDQLTVTVLDNNGCAGVGMKEVRIAPRPLPNFSMSPGYETDPETGEVDVTFNLYDSLMYIPEDPTDVFPVTYEWNFGRQSDGNFYYDHADITAGLTNKYVFDEPYEYGQYVVELVGYLDTSRFANCITRYQDTLDVDIPTALFIPNALCPTDKYAGSLVTIIKALGTNIEKFNMTIYDAWGNIVWYTDQLSGGSPVEFWDGTGLDGEPLKTGLYTWHIDATFRNGKKWDGLNHHGKKRTFGSIQLLR